MMTPDRYSTMLLSDVWFEISVAYFATGRAPASPGHHQGIHVLDPFPPSRRLGRRVRTKRKFLQPLNSHESWMRQNLRMQGQVAAGHEPPGMGMQDEDSLVSHSTGWAGR